MFKLGLKPYYNTTQVIAIGDIHAGFDKLSRLFKNLEPINSETHVVFTGDLLDRGVDVFAVLDFILNLQNKYPGQIFLIEGNHDRYLKDFLYPEKVNNSLGNWAVHKNNQMWVHRYGGQQTIDAFKNRYLSDSTLVWREQLIKDGYWQIFEKMIPYYESESLFISHAPVDGFDLYMNVLSGDEETESEVAIKLLGVAESLERRLRTHFSEEVNLKIAGFEEFDLGKTFICGHQASSQPEPRIIGNRVFLDVSNYNELYAYCTKSRQLISSK